MIRAQHGILDFSGQRALAKGIQGIGTREDKKSRRNVFYLPL